MPTRHGFTLIELLLVIAVIAILAGMLLAGGMVVRESSRRGQANALVSLLHQALQTYRAEDLRGRYPPAIASGAIDFAPPGAESSAPRTGNLLERVGFVRSQGRAVADSDGSRRMQDPWQADVQYRVDALVDGTPHRPADDAGQVLLAGDAPGWNPQGQQPYAYVWSYGRDQAGSRLKANAANWIYVRQSP